MKKLAFSLLTASAALAAAPCSHADVVTYTDPASYAAASTGNTTYAFPYTGAGSVIASPYTLGPLTFTNGGNFTLYNDDDYGTGVGYLSSGIGSETDTLGGATALSFEIGTFTAANTITLTINGVTAGTFTSTGGFPTETFIGVTSDAPITSVGFSLPNSTELDVVSFQVGSAVPEPSTWAMLGLGAAGVGVTAFRRRRTVA